MKNVYRIFAAFSMLCHILNSVARCEEASRKVSEPQRTARHSSVATPYSFNYWVNSPGSGLWIQRDELGSGAIKKGGWQVALPDHRVQKVSYIAGSEGFNAHISYHPLKELQATNIVATIHDSGSSSFVSPGITNLVKYGAPISINYLNPENVVITPSLPNSKISPGVFKPSHFTPGPGQKYQNPTGHFFINSPHSFNLNHIIETSHSVNPFVPASPNKITKPGPISNHESPLGLISGFQHSSFGQFPVGINTKPQIHEQGIHIQHIRDPVPFPIIKPSPPLGRPHSLQPVSPLSPLIDGGSRNDGIPDKRYKIRDKFSVLNRLSASVHRRSDGSY